MGMHASTCPTEPLKGARSKAGLTAAALTLAVLAVWRMPDALGLPSGSVAFAGHPLSVALVAAIFLLFRHAFACGDVRLRNISGGIGLVFSGFTVVGKQMEAAGTLPPFGWGTALGGLLSLLLLALVYGSAVLLIYQGAEAITQQKPASQKESLFSRILGNGFVVLPFLMLCWVPVWLAFWPGTFMHDAVTQFYTYLDWQHSAHHPLLHTLLMSSCIMLGIDNSPDGSAAIGLAIYSVVQMLLLASMLAYACHWLRRRSAPLWFRACLTLLFALFPFYSLWSFNAQKDVLFAGLAMLFVLQLTDVWREGFSLWRIVRFGLLALLMMLMRNNGVYALLFLIPFAVLWAKGRRLRTGGLLAGCAVLYFLANGLLMWSLEATSPSKVEFMSIPLQQIARTLRDDPAATEADTDGLLDILYGGSSAEVYVPLVADPVKWATIDDTVDEYLPELLSLWVKMSAGHLKPYAEAFLAQNLPYFLPGTNMLYRFDMGIAQIELYPIEEHSYFPALRTLYQGYEQTLTLFGLPGVRLLSDTAFYVWLCIAGLGLALYRRESQWIVSFVFLLGIWATCLVGPVAIMRYMLSFFYAVPVLLGAMLAPRGGQV